MIGVWRYARVALPDSEHPTRRETSMINLKQIGDWLKGRDTYELRDRVIHRRSTPFREDTLPIDEIETWTSHPEMTFDVVEIHRKDGTVLIWFDYENDLKAILGAHSAEDREKGMGTVEFNGS